MNAAHALPLLVTLAPLCLDGGSLASAVEASDPAPRSPRPARRTQPGLFARMRKVSILQFDFQSVDFV